MGHFIQIHHMFTILTCVKIHSFVTLSCICLRTVTELHYLISILNKIHSRVVLDNRQIVYNTQTQNVTYHIFYKVILRLGKYKGRSPLSLTRITVYTKVNYATCLFYFVYCVFCFLIIEARCFSKLRRAPASRRNCKWYVKARIIYFVILYSQNLPTRKHHVQRRGFSRTFPWWASNRSETPCLTK